MSDPLADFDYFLPDEQVARFPPEHREGARLLHVGPRGFDDRNIRALPDLLRAGDLLVVNNTQVLRARVQARRATGGRVELLFLREQDGLVEALGKPLKKLKAGERLTVVDPASGAPLPDLGLRVAARASGTVWLEAQPSAGAVMEAAGQMPIPPYLGRQEVPEDRVRYQTTFAKEPGAVAAPTAGLHLTTRLLDQLEARGIERVEVTLHVGAGTFRNLRPEDLARGELHAERYHVSEEAAARINETRRRGGRVVAVGTTSTRTLETVATPDGRVVAGEGTTRLFLQPGCRFSVVDVLLTNFHLPRSSLLLLVSAFGGRDRILDAYRHAVEQGYRFYSFGDAMLVEADSAKTD